MTDLTQSKLTSSGRRGLLKNFAQTLLEKRLTKIPLGTLYLKEKTGIDETSEDDGGLKCFGQQTESCTVSAKIVIHDPSA